MKRVTSTKANIIRSQGLTLSELLVVIVIIGITAAVGIQGFFFLVRRARVQSVALEVAGWIENVRNSAADEINQADTQGGCAIAFTPVNGMIAGASLATVDLNCRPRLPEDELFIPQTIQQDSVNVAIADGPATVVFTPRGLWTNDIGQTGLQFLMEIRLNGTAPLRCVRLSPTLGSVEVGRPANSAADECTQWQTL